LDFNKSVRITLPIPSLNKSFDLKAGICAVREDTNRVVVELQGIRKDKAYADLELVDKLDLRSALVQNSHNMQSVVSDDVTPLIEEGDHGDQKIVSLKKGRQ